ncbi:3-hydroxymethyl-3-methylglutaryl-coenzyme a lyase [Fusarium agapanthi]|uniref:3-hydroxymethyl-3-methylglutaryl-coenzyme a lyase n=1 Tax=Fusarium agapanthi TaxID=1803897 RepID=A0A9P5B0J4_9HYPO|nr:3-hydroxymethyl-3-methylglutaryl-coenzyme a lyase [Fusarium agapanthi]
MASVTANPLAALASQFGHPDLLQRLSTIEAQLAKLSDQEGQEQRFDFNQPFPTQHCDIPVSPTQPRSSTYLDQAESITPPFSTIPPDDVVQHLVNTCFTHVHNQPYAYFQEEHYRQLFSFMLLPKCLTFAILASSVRFPDHEYFSGRTHDAMEGYARQAWLCVLNVAQTTNILAIIDFTVRICQDLQLMNEPNPMLPIVEQEERIRVFWSVYLLEKLVFCGRARLPAIADEDCHGQLPCEEEVFRTGTWKQNPTLHRLLNWDADLDEIRGYFTLAILVASALGRCARYVLHQREIDDTLPWDSRSEFAAINSFLLLIEQHLQVEEVPIQDIISQNKLPTGTPDHRVVGHAVLARIVFHLCRCLIGHPFLLALRLQNLKIPSLLHSAQEAGCHVDASFYAYSTCVAGSILSMFIHGKESMAQIPSQQLLESGQHSLEILDKMGHFWDHAAKMHTQLLNFDTHSQGFEKMIDPHAVFDISPDLETLLWSMVDYGSMCGSSRTRSISPGDGQFSVNMNSPSFFNFDVNMTPRSFKLSGAEGINGARHTMRSYVMS